jgi:hypothetical protein
VNLEKEREGLGALDAGLLAQKRLRIPRDEFIESYIVNLLGVGNLDRAAARGVSSPPKF